MGPPPSSPPSLSPQRGPAPTATSDDQDNDEPFAPLTEMQQLVLLTIKTGFFYSVLVGIRLCEVTRSLCQLGDLAGLGALGWCLRSCGPVGELTAGKTTVLDSALDSRPNLGAFLHRSVVSVVERGWRTTWEAGRQLDRTYRRYVQLRQTFSELLSTLVRPCRVRRAAPAPLRTPLTSVSPHLLRSGIDPMSPLAQLDHHTTSFARFGSHMSTQTSKVISRKPEVEWDVAVFQARVDTHAELLDALKDYAERRLDCTDEVLPPTIEKILSTLTTLERRHGRAINLPNIVRYNELAFASIQARKLVSVDLPHEQPFTNVAQLSSGFVNLFIDALFVVPQALRGLGSETEWLAGDASLPLHLPVIDRSPFPQWARRVDAFAAKADEVRLGWDTRRGRPITDLMRERLDIELEWRNAKSYYEAFGDVVLDLALRWKDVRKQLDKNGRRAKPVPKTWEQWIMEL